MKHTEQNQGRRSREEWRRLVDEWLRSGLTAREFASMRDINPRSLPWWKWHLSRSTSIVTHSRSRKAPPPAVRMVPVEVVSPMSSSAESSWELVTRSGHKLTVRGPLSGDDLTTVLSMLSRTGR